MKQSVKKNNILLVCELLDHIYFKNNEKSPRNIQCKMIGHQGGKLLDICTGTASNIIPIAMYNNKLEITGIDLSEKSLKIAKHKILKRKLEKINLLRMDATKLKFDDETFDFVTVSLALHEIRPDLIDKMICEIKRVLNKDGYFIIIEWESPQRTSFYTKLLFSIIRLVEHKGFSLFLKKDLISYLEGFGFVLEEEIHANYTKVIKMKIR